MASKTIMGKRVPLNGWLLRHSILLDMHSGEGFGETPSSELEYFLQTQGV
jgi:hypothetical protein